MSWAKNRLIGFQPPLNKSLPSVHHTHQTIVAVASVNFKQSVEKVADVNARACWLSECFQRRIEQNCQLIDPPSRKFIVKGVLPSLKFRTDHFIAISEATRNDLVTKLGIEPERISVVLSCAEERLRPYPNASEVVKRLYGLEGPFLLFVGTAKPNKNIGRLLDAFTQLRTRHPNAQLVIAGFVLPFWEETKRILKGEPGVKWFQYVPDEHLPILYSACTALVSPSLNEGFGLPLLEAMACGAPVLAGNTGAQPEVVGDAGILVNPYDTDAIVRALFTLWEDASLRRQLSQKALERARSFTPQRTLQQLLAAYETALRGR
jgi:glycosyltransferase involved in cell wall biosynthesis